MSTWDGNNFYYSGQGVVLIGKRDSSGKAAGLIPVGNVSDLKISIATSVLEHKESQTGQRGIDLRLTTEVKGTLSATLEKYDADNLALALRGDSETKLAASVTTELVKGYWGKVAPVKYSQISSLAIERGSGPSVMAAYVNDATAYDYKFNAAAGSILLNTGRNGTLLTASATANGVVPTNITVGNPTIVTVTNTAAVGDWVALSGFAGADALELNNKAFKVVAASATQVSLEVNTTGKTITIGTPLAVFDGFTMDIDYSYAQQNVVQALTQGSSERFLRFEGLNTADDNKSVVIEVYKFLVDPTKELSMISDTVQQFVLEGNMLADPLQTTGSKYFRELLLR